MVRFLAALLLIGFATTAFAIEEKNEIPVPLDDCKDEPAAVSSLESLVRAVALVRSQTRMPIHVGDLALKLDRLAATNAPVASYMEAFNVPASVGFELADLNRDARAINAKVQTTGGYYKYDPCTQNFFPMYKSFEIYKELKTLKKLDFESEMLIDKKLLNDVLELEKTDPSFAGKLREWRQRILRGGSKDK